LPPFTPIPVPLTSALEIVDYGFGQAGAGIEQEAEPGIALCPHLNKLDLTMPTKGDRSGCDVVGGLVWPPGAVYRDGLGDGYLA
jgi:hypothetical protein